MTVTPVTASNAGLVSCETCSLLLRPAYPDCPGCCPRCGGELEFRVGHSIQYTWALVAAAGGGRIKILPLAEFRRRRRVTRLLRRTFRRGSHCWGSYHIAIDENLNSAVLRASGGRFVGGQRCALAV